MADFLYFICIFLLSYFLSRVLINHGHGKAFLAIPNERSSHSTPTPTSGGFAILVSFLVFLVWQKFLYNNVSSDLILISVCACILGLLGYIDDRKHISARWRLLVHFLVASFLIIALSQLPSLNLFGRELANEVVLTPVIYAVGLVWLINLFNFMDGIDGIASIEAISVLLGAVLILWLQGQAEQFNWVLALVFSVGGFAILNWAPAKIFMGDVGSGFLGAMLGGFALITSASGAISLWSWLILLAVFISDATVTLMRRGIRRQRVYEAHRSHAYQILSRRINSHAKVTLLVLLLNICWLTPLAVWASFWQEFGFLIALAAYLPIFVIVIKIGAGTTND